MQPRSGVFTALIVSDSCEAWQRGGVDVRVERNSVSALARACVRECVFAYRSGVHMSWGKIVAVVSKLLPLKCNTSLSTTILYSIHFDSSIDIKKWKLVIVQISITVQLCTTWYRQRPITDQNELFEYKPMTSRQQLNQSFELVFPVNCWFD